MPRFLPFPAWHHAVAALAALLVSAAVHAGTADGELRLVVGFAVGTGPDAVARLIGPKLGAMTGSQVVVDNRSGAGGQIAARYVATAAPDGHTLLLGEVGSIAIAPTAVGRLPYQPAQDLAALSEVARAEFVLAVPASSPAQRVADVVAQARAQAGGYNFATFGPGTPSHFGAELFAQTAGFRVEPIHYRSPGDAVIGVGRGDVQALFLTTAAALAQVKAGTVRVLATAAPRRAPQFPDVPTLAEAGYPQVEFSAWFAFFVPAATPAAVRDRLSRHIVAATHDPEVAKSLQDAGFSVVGTSQAEAVRMVEEETRRWARVIRTSGFKMD